MTIQDCHKFANENKICHLATTEGDQPRVRALLFAYADETGFYPPSQKATGLPVDECY